MSVSKKGKQVWSTLWIAWTFTLLFNWVAFLYIGVRCKERKWIFWGVIYSLPLILLLIFSNSKGMLENLIMAGLLASSVASVCHAFWIRKEYLHSLVRQDSQVSVISNTIEQMPKITDSPPESVNLIKTSIERQIPPDNNVKPTELIIGEVENPLVEISRFNPSKKTKYEELVVNDSVKSTLNAIMHQAPNLALSGVMSKTYLLKFSPEIASQLAKGTAEKVLAEGGGIRAVVRDTNTKEFLGQGRLLPLNPVAATAAAWQVLAIVTAQKFLSDINKRLTNIEKGISEIKEFLEIEQYGKITGNFKYLYDLANWLGNQRLTPERSQIYDNQLENIERECLQIMISLQQELASLSDEIMQTSLDGTGLKEHYGICEASWSEYGGKMNSLMRVLYVRAAGAQLKCALPGNRAMAELRIEELVKQLQAVETAQDIFCSKFEWRIGDLKGFWSFEKTDKEYQSRLRNHVKIIKDRCEDVSKEVGNVIRATRDNVESQKEELSRPISMEVTLDKKGNVSKIRKVVSN